MRPYEDSSYHQDWSSFASGQNNVTQPIHLAHPNKIRIKQFVSLNLFTSLDYLSGFTIAAKQKKEECMSPGMDVYGYIVIEY